jgi:hypothetical protein
VLDPLNLPFARRLNRTLAARFPERPVKYMVYTGVDGNRSVLASARLSSPAAKASWLRNRCTRAAVPSTWAARAWSSLSPAPPSASIRRLSYFPDQKLVFATRHPSFMAPFADRAVRATAIAQWLDTVARLDSYSMLQPDGRAIARGDVDAAPA